MLSPNGGLLAVLLTILALGVPAIAALTWRRLTGHTPVTVAARVLVVGLAQLLAVSAVFVWVNRSFAFYTSWDDLLGRTHQETAITTGLGATPAGSRTEVLDVAGPHTGAAHHALAWLPPQYDEPQYAHTRFPVVVFLPGQPSTPGLMLSRFQIAKISEQEVAQGHAKPFVVVVPPLMTDPPRDTECTDVPGGPQALSYLTQDVPDAISRQLRVQPRGPDWTLAGWSTGGFCAAKVGLTQPGDWGHVISFGGYYAAVTDRTTGDLFHGDRRLRLENSPVWLYEHHGGQAPKMLLVSGREDKETWPSTTRMLQVVAGDPDVSYIAFPHGGHNFQNYRSYLAQALAWAHGG